MATSRRCPVLRRSWTSFWPQPWSFTDVFLIMLGVACLPSETFSTGWGKGMGSPRVCFFFITGPFPVTGVGAPQRHPWAAGAGWSLVASGDNAIRDLGLGEKVLAWGQRRPLPVPQTHLSSRIVTARSEAKRHPWGRAAPPLRVKKLL